MNGLDAGIVLFRLITGTKTIRGSIVLRVIVRIGRIVYS